MWVFVCFRVVFVVVVVVLGNFVDLVFFKMWGEKLGEVRISFDSEDWVVVFFAWVLRGCSFFVVIF